MLKTYYFVCLSFLLIVTDVAQCEHYVFNVELDGFLNLYSTPEKWEEAFVRCHKDGAVLASPLNKELAKALHSQMKHFGANGRIFLGTHDLLSDGNYVSVEGVPLSDMDIRWGSSGSGAGTGHCLIMSVDGSTYYSSCEAALPFVCYKKYDNQTMNECGTFDNEYHLNQQTGSCYKIHLKRQSWSRAHSICHSEGGYLAILNDEEEASIVKDMFPASTHNGNPYDGLHIGLVAWGKERIWTTIHGERIEDVFNKWQTGEPNNWGGIENRGLLLWNGKLDDADSTGIHLDMFACEISPEFEEVPYLKNYEIV